MSSEDTQSGKKKRIPNCRRKYDHSKPSPPIAKDSRQALNKNKVKEIDYDMLEKYMWTKPTLVHTALFFGVSGDTIERAIQERYALSFADFRERHIQLSRNLLVQKAMQRAIEHNSDQMLKFALENLAGWTSKQDVAVNEQKPIVLRYNLDDEPPAPNIKDVTPKKTGT